MTSTNWKNVNNWHWVEKNCLPWAKEYFNVLKGITVTDDKGTQVTVAEVSDVQGDVDLNQRKGKIIHIFDLAITLKWTGKNASGTDAAGKIVIPEFMHDTDLDELVFDVTVDADNRERHEIKEVARKKLTGEIRKAFANFTKDLLESHSKDVYIPPTEMKGHPVLSTYQPKPPVASSAAASQTSKGKEGVLGGLVTINQKIEFVASARDIYDTLLDQGRASIWTRGKAEVSKAAGSSFRLFDGNVSGTITSVTENKRIEMKWRLKSWPENHFSTVTIDLDDDGEQTILKLKQADVPVGEKESTEINWKNYYWNPIKGAFGFGALL